MIKRTHHLRTALALLALGSALQVHAQHAPGEDPVQLNAPVQYLNLPIGGAQKSGQIDGRAGMPAWMQARVARYEAKSFSASANDGTILTNNDVVNTVTAQGLSKTCVQEVGGTSPATNSLGNKSLSGQQQIVVLRGDLVNICR